jgi:N-acetylmuramoyl-L-alanine amidase
LLERQGLTVALTRTADYRITISNRAAIADRLGAKAFVSIHHNSPTPSTPNEAGTPGTEVYPQLGSEEASRLGGLIYDDVVAALAPFDIEWSAAANAGVIQVINSAGEDAYGIVRRPSVPTALVELAYLSNPPEALLISTVDYRQTAAAALAQAIARFVNTTDVGTGFVEEPRLTDPSAETGGSDGCIDPPLE